MTSTSLLGSMKPKWTVNPWANASAAPDLRLVTISDSKSDLGFDLQPKNTDELYSKAVSIVVNQQKVSTSFIQRYLQIGYNRAARIVEQMEDEGIISEASHAGKRSVLKK